VHQVSIPLAEVAKITSPEEVPGGQEQADPLLKLSVAFPVELIDGHVHVIVVSPSGKKSSTTHTLDIEAIDEKINEEFDSLRGMVEAFLRNPEPRTWRPPNSVTLSDRKFLTNLRIPSNHNGDPHLLLHNLNSCDDKEIKMIFGHGAHMYVVKFNCALNTFSTRTSRFICNTSGSGKTRRMLEGLTKYWGFYLVGAPDVSGVGVRDLRDALAEVSEYSEWVSDLETVDRWERATQGEVNSRIAAKHLRKVLAARIVVFRLFLQVAIQVHGALQEEHKYYWLLFQLSDELAPSSDSSHPFVRIITECLHRATDEALNLLVGRLEEIRYQYLSHSHFILVLDEAQRASRLYPRCFISSTNPDKFQSIIREVVKVFTKLPIKLVVAGTGLRLAELEDALASGVSNPAETVQLFHNLGMFDTWPKLKSFLERYVPASIFESPSGYRLQQRIWEYLQGRLVDILFSPNESHWRQISLLRILCGILPEKWAAVATQIAK
jgi:hypothetical protein